MEETAKLTVKKLVAEHASRDVEVQTLEEREKQLKHEVGDDEAACRDG